MGKSDSTSSTEDSKDNKDKKDKGKDKEKELVLAKTAEPAAEPSNSSEFAIVQQPENSVYSCLFLHLVLSHS